MSAVRRLWQARHRADLAGRQPPPTEQAEPNPPPAPDRASPEREGAASPREAIPVPSRSPSIDPSRGRSPAQPGVDVVQRLWRERDEAAKQQRDAATIRRITDAPPPMQLEGPRPSDPQPVVVTVTYELMTYDRQTSAALRDLYARHDREIEAEAVDRAMLRAQAGADWTAFVEGNDAELDLPEQERPVEYAAPAGPDREEPTRPERRGPRPW